MNLPPFVLIALGLGLAALISFNEEVATATLLLGIPLAFALQLTFGDEAEKSDGLSFLKCPAPRVAGT